MGADHRTTSWPRWLWLTSVVPLLVGCGEQVPSITYEVLRNLPHDRAAYTQGLLFHDGILYESTGRYGESTVRKVDPDSGEVIAMQPLADEYFGEGLALVDDRLIQLTWKLGKAFVYDASTLAVVDSMTYEGEGWGLCWDGSSLFMSDGSSRIARRDPVTFDVLEELTVTRSGFPVSQLNELECVGDRIYANVFTTDEILEIDKHSGRITGSIDAFPLSANSRRGPGGDAVLNGIAYDPATDLFYITGKLWPSLFEVRLNRR